MAKYSKKSQDMVESAMHRKKKGTLRSGNGTKVKNSKQAIAIGLSEARSKGAKVPKKKTGSKSSSSSSSKRGSKTGRKTASKSGSGRGPGRPPGASKKKASKKSKR